MLKRITLLYTLTILCFMLLLVRIAAINNSGYSDVAESQSQRTVVIGRKRGEIYDRNLQKLVGNKERIISVITPCAAAFPYLKDLKNSEEILKKLEKGYPFLLETGREINNDVIRSFYVPVRYDGTSLACHVTGYLDSEENNGITGIERAFDSLLSEGEGSLTATFQVDALGRVVAGGKKEIADNNFTSKSGVVLTLDKNIQEIAEKALAESEIVSGCALVMHVDSGDILAMASVPVYDRNNVADSLDKENSPLVNKTLQAYAVGSVFKPIVAAAALESGYDPTEEYECDGKVTIGDRTFSCYEEKSHGKVNMEGALEKSCNTYFIKLIEKIDLDLLLSICVKIGFGEARTFASTIKSSQGKLPTAEELKLKGELANFAFGQGSLLATPIQLLEAYHALATGNHVKSRLVYGFADNYGLIKGEYSEAPVKIFEAATVMKIREMLSCVVEKGNADKAKSSLISLAGKTGTAQSGIFSEGKEICRTWFAGFFPSHNPHYIVVVLNENGKGGNRDCAGVYKAICEGIVTN